MRCLPETDRATPGSLGVEYDALQTILVHTAQVQKVLSFVHISMAFVSSGQVFFDVWVGMDGEVN